MNGGVGDGNFADEDVSAAYSQALTKMNIGNPSEARLYVRSGDTHSGCMDCQKI